MELTCGRRFLMTRFMALIVMCLANYCHVSLLQAIPCCEGEIENTSTPCLSLSVNLVCRWARESDQLGALLPPWTWSLFRCPGDQNLSLSSKGALDWEGGVKTHCTICLWLQWLFLLQMWMSVYVCERGRFFSPEKTQLEVKCHLHHLVLYPAKSPGVPG